MKRVISYVNNTHK